MLYMILGMCCLFSWPANAMLPGFRSSFQARRGALPPLPESPFGEGDKEESDSEKSSLCDGTLAKKKEACVGAGMETFSSLYELQQFMKAHPAYVGRGILRNSSGRQLPYSVEECAGEKIIKI